MPTEINGALVALVLLVTMGGCSKYTEPGAFYDPFHPQADGWTGMVSCDASMNYRGECDAWEGRYAELAEHKREYSEDAAQDALHQCAARATAGLRKHKVLGIAEWVAVAVPPCMPEGEALWMATQVQANRIAPAEEPGGFTYYRADRADIARLVEAAVSTQYRVWLEDQ